MAFPNLHLLSLADTIDPNEAADAAQAVLAALPSTTPELPVLPVLARVMARCSAELGGVFAKVMLLHFHHPHLYSQLLSVLRPAASGPYGVPDWVPLLSEPVCSVLDYYANVELVQGDSKTAVLHVTVDALNGLERRDWRLLARLALQSPAHRDLISVVVLHDISAVQLLLSGKNDALFLLNLISLRAGMVCVLAKSAFLPGAAHLLTCTSLHLPALALAGRSPFLFFVDCLNQGSMDCSECPTLPSATHLAAVAVVRLCADRRALYAHFNLCCSTTSLAAVLADFGFAVARLLLPLYGYSFPPSVVALAHIARHAPMAKPNYFFADRSLKEDAWALLQTLDDTDAMCRGVFYVLKALVQVLPAEMAAGSPSLVVTRMVQKTMCFVVAALMCTRKHGGSAADHMNVVAAQCVQLLLASAPAPVVWVAVFNFANDVCYTEVELAPVIARLFDQVLTAHDISDFELVMSGLRLFAATFGVALSNPLLTVPAAEGVSKVSQDELQFLYAPPRREQVTREPASRGARQQSVHVDKFGK